MIKNTADWLTSIRELSLLPEAPVQQKNGRWKVTDRLNQWKRTGPKIFDDYLEHFQKVAIEVFREPDPQFDLEKDERFAASLFGKGLKHSQSLRTGLAETLALLGSYPEYLTSSSSGKAEYTARMTVVEIFREASWSIWASLNDVMPLLAEAAPKEFLDSVERALNSEPCPLDGVFAQEGSGMVGRTYITGLLWGLETLAWDTTYLTRVVMILGELSARDPGGSWANRPSNSLSTILLPWFPQTCAPVEKRISAVATLQRELPEIAWKLLLNLLPRSQQSSSMTHRPIWRKIIPDEWPEGSTGADYWAQITSYAEMAIAAARLDQDKLVKLIRHMNQLPFEAREQVLSYLNSDVVTSLSEEKRLPIWNELADMITSHRKFSDAKWAMPPTELERIVAIAESIEPESPALKYRRLFTTRDLDLYEEKDNFQEQQQRLEKRRRDAVSEIYSDGGIPGIVMSAEAVESPWKLGIAFGETARDQDDIEILPRLLESKVNALIEFAAGFEWGRFHAKGWAWFDHLDLTEWTNNQKALLLANLPFDKGTWERAFLLLGPEENLYWQTTQVNPYQATSGLAWAIDRLLENNRVNAAISVLDRLFYSQETIDPQQLARALKALGNTSDPLRSADTHTVTQLIGALQRNPKTDEEDLFKIEWQFLGLLDGIAGPSPTLLERTLATNPDFFCQVIQLTFRSDKKDQDADQPSESREALATNAYRLLQAWKTPPGTQEDGTFDGNALKSWLEEAKTKCSESGHLKIAMRQVGEVLFYSPPDPGGFWLHHAAASVLNDRDSEDLRSGFESAVFSSRGVYFPDAEGRAEREYASIYRKQADEAELAGYQRLAITIREVAETYDRQAEQAGERMLLDE